MSWAKTGARARKCLSKIFKITKIREGEDWKAIARLRIESVTPQNFGSLNKILLKIGGINLNILIKKWELNIENGLASGVYKHFYAKFLLQ